MIKIEKWAENVFTVSFYLKKWRSYSSVTFDILQTAKGRSDRQGRFTLHMKDIFCVFDENYAHKISEHTHLLVKWTLKFSLLGGDQNHHLVMLQSLVQISGSSGKHKMYGGGKLNLPPG